VVVERGIHLVDDINLALERPDSLFGALDMVTTITGIPDAYITLEIEVSIIPQETYEEL
jgi:hypothetical protein